LPGDGWANQGNDMISAAHIKIAKPEPLDPIAGLRKMLDGFSPEINKHDRADALIEACLSQGVADPTAISELADRLGFNPVHVRIRLVKGAGPNPNASRWWRDAEGRYHLHN
jgi:hypothetical protein